MPLEPDDWNTIHDAFNHCAVLVFPGQVLQADQHVAFANRFGPIDSGFVSQMKDRVVRTPPEIADVSNLDGAGNLLTKDDRLLYFQAQQPAVAHGQLVQVHSGPSVAALHPVHPAGRWTYAPRSLVILGGGPIGCEMGLAFGRLGIAVTLVELADRLLPREEPEASAVVAAALRRVGVTVRTGLAATGVERHANGEVVVTRGEPSGIPSPAATVTGSEVLVALGRVPAGRGFGLEEIGVDIGRNGAIAVDDTMATNVAGIWAVGDVVGRAQFTHAAGRMGWVATTNALSRTAFAHKVTYNERVLPWATFTSPAVGSIG